MDDSNTYDVCAALERLCDSRRVIATAIDHMLVELSRLRAEVPRAMSAAPATWMERPEAPMVVTFAMFGKAARALETAPRNQTVYDDVRTVLTALGIEVQP